MGVWVGNASGAPMWDVSGTTGAAPIWAAVMHYLHTTQPSRTPKPPTGVVQVPVRFAAPGGSASSPLPIEAARTEWFVQGTQQTSFAMHSIATLSSNSRAGGQKGFERSRHQPARITSPTTGTIIALDPAIPHRLLRVRLRAEGAHLRWLLDGNLLAVGASAQWLPWPGRHVVQIADAKGKVLDEVKLEVRGAGVKAR